MITIHNGFILYTPHNVGGYGLAFSVQRLACVR